MSSEVTKLPGMMVHRFCVGKAKKKGQEQWQKKQIAPKDEGLQGNEKIEEAILELQKEPTPELLAHVLTVIRRRMKEGGQAILSVEPPSGDDQIRIGTVKSADEKVWWAAFTSFDEELKGRRQREIHVSREPGAADPHGI